MQNWGTFAWSGSYKVLGADAVSLAGMNGRGFFLSALAAAGLLATAACAPNAGEGVVVAASDSPASTPQGSVTAPRAMRLAQDLAAAETAHDLNDTSRLSELVGGLYASGIAPQDANVDGASGDLLGKWAAASGGQAMPYRGRLLGPAYVRGELAAGEVWKSAQTFKSGVPSTLAVSHKGSGPVSISVSDQRSRRVCNAARSSAPSCRFTPMYTQRYSIELVNEGSERAVYFLVFD